MAQRVTEIKRQVDGRVEQFACDLLYRHDGVMIVRFVAQPGTRFYELMAYSDGFFWAGRNYIMYRIVGHDGEVAARRFDICRDVRIGPATVEFTDLFLDVRVTPGGDVTEEDEEELENALALGVIEEADYDLAYDAREALLATLADVFQETETLHARALAGAPPC